ncbi:DUF5671 domain-containing protein [Agromyces marinus]|uniref:DUF5671 domain-containing protein n=1 Tax=Agromyces marinus TaxID=1389020 RepID=A0ABN6YGC8_9MICO|nr:DUF5671 domain-containing protein [Agromyces marinus]UIP59915.1 hypothetical protein DSM26151_28290 [Agromyces marinus]BDZ54993.1 hypothetical protein GCM10025870_20660 [Agromyces marinus]
MSAPGGGGTVQGVVRRLIVFVLLFALVTIAAIGVSGLLDRALESGRGLAGDDPTGLAVSLAFTLIGGPLAALLWWAAWRRLAEPAERGSVAWGIYLAGMTTVSLVVATSALATTLVDLVDADWNPGAFTIALTWAAVWIWHRRMLRHPAKAPTRLPTVPLVLGAAYGLIVGARGAILALAELFDAALRTGLQTVIVGEPWGLDVVGHLIWAALGIAVWWWHWAGDGVRRIPTAFAGVEVVVVGVLGGAVAALSGLAIVLFVGLRLVFDPADGAASILGSLDSALASAAVGALVWRLHARVARRSSEAIARAAVLVVSGVGLVAAASGIGVIVNAALAAFTDPLATSGTRELLLGGISALLVGGPTWWATWRPTRRVPDAAAAGVGRRVYLVAVFGVSAIVAIVAVLVVGFRLFEFLLDAGTGSALIDRIRAPFGLLVATALVFAYHFAVWRGDRAALAASGAAAPQRRIGRIVLVAAGDTEEIRRALAAATGSSVTVWARQPVDGDRPIEPEALVAALEGVSGRRVMLLVGPGERVEALQLVE